MSHYSDILLEEAKKERAERTKLYKETAHSSVDKMDYWDLKILNSILKNWNHFKGFLNFIKKVEGIEE